MEKPKLIFKYRSLTTLTEIVRFSDIVNKRELYLPTIPQLNDPFEGRVNVALTHAGNFITRALDKDFGPVMERKEKTRLLSLSEDCFSPQLWAYYCNDYHGVCICFKTDKAFSGIESVIYPEKIDEDKMVLNPQINEIYGLIRDSLLRKQKGWRYEREWRMIFQPDLNDDGIEINEAPSKLYFDEDELVGVIVGNKLTKEERAIIRAIVPDNVKMFTVHTGSLTGLVKLEEYGYEYPGNGSQPDYISTTDELYKRIFT